MPHRFLRPNPDAIRQARMFAGLSQRDLAAKAGIRQATVSSIEQGQPARPSTMRLIAAVLGRDIADLAALPLVATDRPVTEQRQPRLDS